MEDITKNILFEESRSANLRAGLAQADAAAAESKARMTQEQLNMMTQQASSNESHNRQLISSLRKHVDTLNEKLLQQTIANQKLERLLTEWRHSHEGFRRLAREFASRLGLGEVERQRIFLEMLLNVAEDDPSFANTEVISKAKARLAGLDAVG
ncbi:hypothetical protein [Massilia sp. NP310]|uniref:hypothetical protein n=1 Tax=Massilia sp. NP310 TaxID=2861282 RepID=UPI001C632419|nr:hypothetical protein [Massilia sp. NP310]QYG04046.1 hypothetical protein KY496_12010 [Massilia sp. NP310]